MACDVGCHIGQYHIYLPPDHFEETDHGVVVGYVPYDEIDAVERVDVPEVHTDHLSAVAGQLVCHLGPSSGACPQVHDGISLADDGIFLVQLDELI